jgi:cell shape-determining protein MreC
MKCRMLRNQANGTPVVTLERYAITNGYIETMAMVKAETNSTTVQILEADAINHEEIDNENRAYALRFSSGGKTISDGDKVKFYNCVLSYEFD